MNDNDIKDIFGVQYYDSSESKIIEARNDDQYFYQVYIGENSIKVEKGDCIYFVSKDKKIAHLIRGETQIDSYHMAVIIRGYMPESKTSGLYTKTYLPYVNGCSSKQVFSPERLGDPTLQILDIPPYTSEQAHHIHSTVRVVYVLSGKGKSIVGMNKKSVITNLYPGQIIILEKMCPHHFETDDDRLIVLPLHIYSSIGALEQVHPMANGTINIL